MSILPQIILPWRSFKLPKVVALLLPIILASNESFSQKKWRLEPSLGLQNLFNTLEDKEADPSLKANFFDVHPEFGLSIRYKLSRKSLLIAGWKNGGASFSYAFDQKADTLGNNFFLTYRHISTTQVQRFHLVYSYTVNKKLFDRSVKDDRLPEKRYLGMDVRLTIGTSVDYLVNNPNENSLTVQNGLSSLPGLEMTIARRMLINSRYGASLISGVSFDFHNAKKHLITINLNYSKGLSTLFFGELEYSINGNDYKARFRSRGSFLSVGVSYPLKLFKTAEDKAEI